MEKHKPEDYEESLLHGEGRQCLEKKRMKPQSVEEKKRLIESCINVRVGVCVRVLCMLKRNLYPATTYSKSQVIGDDARRIELYYDSTIH